MIANDPTPGIDLLEGPFNNLYTWKYGWMGTCVVEFRPLDLDIHMLVWKIFWELRLCEFLLYLVPTHLVPFSEHIGDVPIDRGRVVTGVVI